MTTDRFRKRLLGISLREHALLVAEIACAKEGKRILHLAEFAYPAGVTLEQPQALGEALGAFLRQQQISARRAILGVPARWLLLKNHSLPPVEPQAAAAMLWLRAESENVPELGEMVFDYSGQTSPLTPSSVMLMGLPRRWLDRLAVLASSAGLSTLSVTPTAAALASATAASTGNAHTLLLTPESAELATCAADQLKFLRHLGSGASLASALVELRRAAATHLLAPPSPLVLWDEIDRDGASLQAITSAVHIPVQPGNLSSLIRDASPKPLSQKPRCAAAVALAAGQGRPAINFLHPRVIAPKKTSISRRTSWITAAAALLAIAALLAFVDISRLQRRLDADESQLKTLEPTLKTARPFVQNMQFVETFESSHPKYLACLRDITNATPPDGQTYLTNFHLQSNMRGDFSGRSSNSQEILNLMDKLNTSKHFLDLKRKLDAGGRAADVSFSVTFTYSPH